MREAQRQTGALQRDHHEARENEEIADREEMEPFYGIYLTARFHSQIMLFSVSLAFSHIYLRWQFITFLMHTDASDRFPIQSRKD